MSIIDGKAATIRKAHPIFTGALLYFPDAFLAVAELSRIGNEQHNPGEPLHWSRGKSDDHGDCLVRHQLDAGKIDTDGVRHSAKVAWRALAQLQLEIEAASGISTGTADVSQNEVDAVLGFAGVASAENRVGEVDRRKVLIRGCGHSRRGSLAGRRANDATDYMSLPMVDSQPGFKVGDRIKDITDGICGEIEAFAPGADGGPGAHVRWDNIGLRIWYPLSQLTAA